MFNLWHKKDERAYECDGQILIFAEREDEKEKSEEDKR